jgi:multisubunit Na+/H+ antiporter MnhC subunit
MILTALLIGFATGIFLTWEILSAHYEHTQANK